MPQLPAFAKYSYIVSALFLLLVSIYRVLVPHIVGKVSLLLGKRFPINWEQIPIICGNTFPQYVGPPELTDLFNQQSVVLSTFFLLFIPFALFFSCVRFFACARVYPHAI